MPDLDPLSLLMGAVIGVMLGGAMDHYVYPLIARVLVRLDRRRPRNGR